MASSNVITTTSQTNPDLPRQPSLCSSLSTLLAGPQNQSQNGLGCMSMDDLWKNIYSSPPPPPTTSDAHPQFPGASISREGSLSPPKDVANKSVDEVWKEIVVGGDQRQEGQSEEMTLEDFLTKAGAVREDDVRGVVNQVGVGEGVYVMDPAVINGGGSQFSAFGNNADHQRLVAPAGGGPRGKRRAVEEPPLDKATQQKQRRMIKNRESAARSRERKQLMENLIPVEEKQRPPRVFRRVHSMQW